MSTAYHLESDGQTEVINRTLQQYLRAFVHDTPSLWTTTLPWAEWCYNTSVHSGTGFSPFEVMFSRPPSSIPDYIPGQTDLEVVDHWLTSRDRILAELQRNLAKSQQQMKNTADAKRCDVEFAVGSWVFVRLRSYRQTSVTGPCPYQKLQKCFFGPFMVTERIGKVAYRLELPAGSRIHPVFHCSVLKPYHGPIPPVVVSLPSHTFENRPVLKPVAILNEKLDVTTDPPKQMVLIQWEGLPPEDASWVSKEEVVLKDKDCFEGRRDDRQYTTQGLARGPLGKRVVNKPNYLKDYV